jgi:hypothetical protein
MTSSDYISNVQIEYQEGPNRLAHMPVGDEPVEFGVHGSIAEHYGMDPDEFGTRNTTIDYVVAAAAG